MEIKSGFKTIQQQLWDFFMRLCLFSKSIAHWPPIWKFQKKLFADWLKGKPLIPHFQCCVVWINYTHLAVGGGCWIYLIANFIIYLFRLSRLTIKLSRQTFILEEIFQ